MKPSLYEHRASQCPGCAQTLNATGDPEDRGPPRAGDLTICSGCGQILRFDHTLRLRTVDAEEIERLPPRTAQELIDMQKRWNESQRKIQVVRS